MSFINATSIRHTVRGLAAIAVLATFGCDDSSGPSTPPGSYHATTFTTTNTTTGQTTNHLSNGSTIALVLNGDGTTSGNMNWLASAAAGNPTMNVNLAGTWTHAGSTIDIFHSTDTFLRDIDFTFTGETLVGDRVFSGVRFQVTFTRDD